ncbi:MAG TPA: fibronectin type III domain-containing protein [Smithella sp.]|jgi:hypothetical protein|nr:fibronectin type III domain-containing protein [Deltaproteobacteria bacterium]HOE33180.1 fibronectin type III domain-containing protein [Smithella sp.]HPC07736.1 fibronectin type III domain-containing protein [Smithella sp.]HPR16073.1 fibronectin type III domain-containing protein [Smithella sp.]HPV50456.1 fibronectin type III domain-containing protein [Smithella sp.]
MKKSLFYLLLISMLIFFVSACSDSDSDFDDTADAEYLTVQMRADAGNGEVSLDWQMLPRAETYNIYYMEDDEDDTNQPTSQKMKSEGTKIDGETNHIISAPYVVTGLENGKTYWFALSAKNAEQAESDLSQAIYAIPRANPPLPAPKNVRANAGDKEATVTWDAVTGAAGYIVYYYTSFANYQESPKITSTSYTFTGLTNKQTYLFFVAAVDSNDNNESGDSSASFVYTTTPSEDPPPSAPRNLRVINRGEGFVDLAWDAPLFHTGALTYNVYFFTAGNITKSTAQKGIEALADTSTRAANLDKEKTHYFVVTAVDNNGESAESGEVSAIPDL